MSLDRVASHPFLLALEKLKLDQDHFVIFGSGPMLAHRIRQNVADLDVVARGVAWEQAHAAEGWTVKDKSRPNLLNFQIGGVEIEIGPEWYTPQGLWSTDELIDTAEVISAYRFARLEYVREYKSRLGRWKDRLDVAAIDAYLTGRRSGR